MGRIRQALRVVATAMASLFFLTLIASNVERLAQKYGWDQILSRLEGPAMSELASLASSNWFWFFGGFIIGCTMALWSDRYMQKFQRQYLKYAQGAKKNDLISLIREHDVVAFQEAQSVLKIIIRALQNSTVDSEKYVGTLMYHRVIDVSDAERSRVWNCINSGLCTVNELQSTIGGYYYIYQAIRTWISQTWGMINHDQLDIDRFIRWKRNDERYLDQIWNYGSRPENAVLHKYLSGSGRGERVTDNLNAILRGL